METGIPQASLRDLFYVLFRRKWSFLFVLAATLFGAVFWLWVVRDDLYVTETKVLVKSGQEEAPPASIVGAGPMVVTYRSQNLNSEIDIFKSSEIIAQVVDKYHLDAPKPPAPVPTKFVARTRYRAKQLVRAIGDWRDELFIKIGLRERLTDREKTIGTLQQALNVGAQRDSNVFVAQLKLPERVGSSIVLSAILDEYLSFRSKMFSTQGHSVFQAEVQRNQGALQRADSDLQHFENTSDIATLEKQQEGLVDQIARARTILRDAQVAYEESSSKVRTLDSEIKKDNPNFGALGDFERESFPQSILRQLADLEKEREKLRMTDLDTTERVVNNRKQFRALAEMLAANLRSTMAEKQSEYEVRKAALVSLQDELTNLHSKQSEWAALKRRSAEAEGIYTFYRRKLEETSASDALEKNRVMNVAVIQHPMDPLQPDGMRKTMLLGIAMGFGFIAALAWISIAEFFDHRVYTIDQLTQHMKAPVLAVVDRGDPLRFISATDKRGDAARTYAGEA
jgi:uncharacterized protein involved in exopolysaccharide biosynthesis